MRDQQQPPGWDWESARATCLSETRRVLADRDAAEDAAQEALLRAWRAQRSRRSNGDATAWLRAIAGNEARRLGARARSLPSLEPIDAHDEADPTNEVGDAQVAAIALSQLLDELAPRDRQLVHLRYVAGLTHSEIARHLRVPEGTVKVRLHRSRAFMRKLLSNEALGRCH
jgi:RNA polymerase sigma-70 factor (ECF subfamily)